MVEAVRHERRLRCQRRGRPAGRDETSSPNAARASRRKVVGKTGLHHRLLVGEVQQQHLVRQRCARGVGDTGDDDLVHAGRQGSEGVDDLRRRARTGDADHRVVGSRDSRLGGIGGVGLAESCRLAQARERLRDEHRGAAADRKHPFTRTGEQPGGLGDEAHGRSPGGRLAVDLFCGDAHGRSWALWWRVRWGQRSASASSAFLAAAASASAGAPSPCRTCEIALPIASDNPT